MQKSNEPGAAKRQCLTRTPVGTACDFSETSYGIVKRVQVFSRWIDDFKRHERRKTVRVLDYGCGTGSMLTRSLGWDGDEILGIDSHYSSVEVAVKQNALRNVRYVVGSLTDLLDRSENFDVIICSEVLEHLEHPETYLRGFRRILNTPGLLIVSVPNGHGPFEQLRRLERRLDDLGVDRVLVWLRKMARSLAILTLRRLGRQIPPPIIGTLNEDSPHINFFKLPKLETMCRRQGFEVVETRGRTLVCGPYVDFWLNRWPLRLLLGLNNALADWLPLKFCSDWMLLLRRVEREE